MTGDCDDCGALALLHALADRGEVEILGCIASYGGNPYVAGCIDAINTYYGRGDLPIGVIHEPYGRTESRYLEAIATDTERYGHDIVTKDALPGHVEMYRKLLAGQPDKRVTIVTVGRLKALSDLLDSRPDDISPLSGTELVRQKVVQWVCMGGYYPNRDGKGEANFKTFGGAGYSRLAVENCPVPAVFSGFEIGRDIMTGSKLLQDSDDNPVARAYRLHLGERHEHHSWDQTAVLFAVRGAEPWWDLVTEGHNDVQEDGINYWRASPDRDQAYLIRRQTPDDVANEIDTLMAEPPAAK